MKVAVTAVSGALGRSIVKSLLTQLPNNQIIGIARTIEKAKNLGVEIKKGNYNNKADFIDALKGIDTVLIISGIDSPDKRIVQHKGIIEAAREVGVKKIVYTSIVGAEEGNAFSPIVASNRQTEKEVKESGMNFVIGRNGLYIEPDIEYIDTYKKEGKIANCAANGKCLYTTRDELAYAYSQMILDDKHNGNMYNLGGAPITQKELTKYMNKAFETNLVYESMTVEDYIAERKAALGDFLGTVIGGFYTGIRNGDAIVDSDYEKAAGRKHIGWDEYFSNLNS